MKHRFALLAVAAALAAPGFHAHAQQVIKLTAMAGHPPAFLWVKLLDEFYIPEVDRRLAATGNKHKVEWTKAWSGTLVKLGGESKGIADGIGDLGFVSTVFEAPKFPLQNVSYFTPFGTDDLGLVTRTVAEMQKSIPAMADAWAKNGLVYLGGAALDTYHLWTKFPVAKYEDLNGKKISAPGPAANWIRNTGAVAVAGNLNSYYEDIKSGVSDGVIVFTTGAWGAKLHEVAPHITKVNFGAMFAGGIAINKARFDRLPPEVQQVLREVGDAYSAEFAKAQSAAAGTLMQNMAGAGARLADLSEAERKRWADALPHVAKTWSDDVTAKGMPGQQVLGAFMGGLAKAGAKVPRDWSR
jgi:TRAP-type C4-dicarboxylate transport system substrate-binding protein